MRGWILGISLWMGTTLVGCSNVAQTGLMGGLNVPVTPINTLKNTPNPQAVYLKGKVTHQASFGGSGAYELTDNTGKIWVFTTEVLPQVGDEMTVKGIVQYQSIPIQGQEMGDVYLKQESQLERKPVSP